MKALRILLATVLAVVLLGGAAYGAGIAVKHYQDGSERASESDRQPIVQPDPSETPTDEPTTPTEPAPPENILQPGAKGEQVRELQHRLFQLAWLPELTTGTYDAATKAAVAGFQSKRGLKSTGIVNDRTWQRLVKLTRTPTHDQMFNILKPGPALFAPGATGDDVRDLQARLQQIAWYFGDVSGTYGESTVSAVRGFQKKRGIPVTGEVDRRTLDRLVAMTYTPTYSRSTTSSRSRARSTRAARPDARSVSTSRETTCAGWSTARCWRRTTSGSAPTSCPPARAPSPSATRTATTCRSSTTPRCRSRCSSPAARRCTTHPTSRPTATTARATACVNVRDYNGMAWLFDQVRTGDKVIVYWS